jgi:hypothetical protein
MKVVVRTAQRAASDSTILGAPHFTTYPTSGFSLKKLVYVAFLFISDHVMRTRSTQPRDDN